MCTEFILSVFTKKINPSTHHGGRVSGGTERVQQCYVNDDLSPGRKRRAGE